MNCPLSMLPSNLIFKVFACNCWEIFVVLFPPGKLQAKYYTSLSNSGWIIHCCVLIYSPHLIQFLSNGGTLRLFCFYFYLDSFSPPTSIRRSGRGRPVVQGVAEEGINAIYFSYPATQPDVPISCSSELILGIVLLDYFTGAQNTG